MKGIETLKNDLESSMFLRVQIHYMLQSYIDEKCYFIDITWLNEATSVTLFLICIAELWRFTVKRETNNTKVIVVQRYA